MKNLVLVPGLLCDALLWRAQIAALGTEARCWVADVRHGDSMHTLADRVLNDCPFERFALAGLSMGGYIALQICALAPARVERLALLDTNARADAPEAEANRRALVARAVGGDLVGVADTLYPRLVHPSRAQDAALAAINRTMALNIGTAAFAQQQQAIITRPDQRPNLPKIDVPALVLCGREDLLSPLDRHEEMSRLLPQAELVVIEQCGHLATLERPDEVSEAMRRWLRA